MTYTVMLRDKSVHSLEDNNANSLKETLANTSNTIMVEIGDTMMRSTEIVSIKRNRLTEADVPVDESKLIAAAKQTCRGQYSIQWAIHEIAIHEHPKEWAKLVQDKAWREQTRQMLRSTPGKWCDYRAGECACEPDFIRSKNVFTKAGNQL